MADQAKDNFNDSPISGWNRDVLFGLLALNKNLIKVEEFMVVLGQWNSDSQKTFRDLFAEALKKPTTELDFIDFLLSEFLKSTSNQDIKNLAILADEILSKNKNLASFELGPLEEISKTLPKEFINDAGRSTKPVSKKKDFSASIVVEGEEELGGGGEGIVFKATEHKLSRQIAIKIAKYKSYEERILREGRTLARLQHPGIVPIHFFGKSENGEPFYGMAILPKDGTLLWKIWKYYQNKPIRNEQDNHIAFRELIQNLVQVCQTIQFAHDQKIIHRDIKPENIMVGSHGEVYVMDWGSALDLNIRHFDDDGSLIDKDSDYFYPRIGTYAYVPPEQIQGQYQNQSEQSDVFMLGGILYRILTHKSPFGGLNGINERMRAEDFDLKPPSNITPDVDLALESICMKAMQRFPEDRYSSAQAMLEDLTRWLADEPVSVFPEPFSKRSARWARRNRTLVTNAASVLILIVFGSIIFAYSQFIARKEIEQQKTVAIDNFGTAIEFSKSNFKLLQSVIPFAKGMQTERFTDLDKQSKTLAEMLQKSPDNLTLKLLCIDVFHETANAGRYIFAQDCDKYYEICSSLISSLKPSLIQPDTILKKAKVLIDYAERYRLTARYKESYNKLEEAISIIRNYEIKNNDLKSTLYLNLEYYNNLAGLYMELGDYNKAHETILTSNLLINKNQQFKDNIDFRKLNYAIILTFGKVLLSTERREEARIHFDWVVQNTNDLIIDPDLSMLRAEALINYYIILGEDGDLRRNQALRINEANRIAFDLSVGLKKFEKSETQSSVIDIFLANNQYLQALYYELVENDVNSAETVIKEALEILNKSINNQDQIEKRQSKIRLLEFYSKLCERLDNLDESKKTKTLVIKELEIITKARKVILQTIR